MLSDRLNLLKNQMKARQNRLIQVRLARFKQYNRYNVRRANRTAPGVCFSLGFIAYLFLAHMDEVLLIFGKTPHEFLTTNIICLR